MSVATDNELFAIFELPMNLSRDTDEGLLILESCPKVNILYDYTSDNFYGYYSPYSF